MRMTAIVERLRQEAGLLREVTNAMTGLAVPKSFPSAWVYPMSERAEPNALLGLHSQRITVVFAVEYAVKHAAQADTGGPAAEAMETVRDAGKGALIGWQPSPDHTAIEYQGGRLLDFDAGKTIWRDEYSVTFYEEHQR